MYVTLTSAPKKKNVEVDKNNNNNYQQFKQIWDVTNFTVLFNIFFLYIINSI
jgi:hypothetical protein